MYEARRIEMSLIWFKSIDRFTESLVSDQYAPSRKATLCKCGAPSGGRQNSESSVRTQTGSVGGRE